MGNHYIICNVYQKKANGSHAIIQFHSPGTLIKLIDAVMQVIDRLAHFIDAHTHAVYTLTREILVRIILHADYFGSTCNV